MAGWGKIQTSLNHFTGKAWKRPNGPLDKATLDATLQSGNPVIMEVGPDKVGMKSIIFLVESIVLGLYWS